MSEQGCGLVPSNFSEWWPAHCLDVIPLRSLRGTHILNARDLEWSFWGGVAGFVFLSHSGMCQAYRRFNTGHRCLGKFLTEGLSGFTSSCCFCDLVRFLVSQKALFLGSCCCIQPCPVITGRQGGLRPASRGVLRYRVSPRVSPQRSGVGGQGVLRRTHFLITAFIWMLHLSQMQSFL